MNYSILLLLSLAVSALAQNYLTRSDTKRPNVTGIFEYPTIFHKCSGTYLNKRWILTAASCVLCLHKCKLQVRNFLNLQNLGNEIYDVVESHYHSDYLLNPKAYDIGLVKINEDSYQHSLFNTPDNMPVGTQGSISFYQMSKDFKNYDLSSGDATIISKDGCSSALEDPVTQICVKGKSVTLGQFDIGTSFVTKQNQEDYIVGLNGEIQYPTNGDTFVLLNVSYFKPWIDSIIKN